ncbi:MAG: hypothetical protein ACR2IF_15405 [Terriglobales bacterium]
MSVQGNAEEVRDKGLSLELIGGMIWFFDFLILFFLPAAIKVGHRAMFLVIMAAFAVIGLALFVSGIVIRSRANPTKS